MMQPERSQIRFWPGVQLLRTITCSFRLEHGAYHRCPPGLNFNVRCCVDIVMMMTRSGCPHTSAIPEGTLSPDDNEEFTMLGHSNQDLQSPVRRLGPQDVLAPWSFPDSLNNLDEALVSKGLPEAVSSRQLCLPMPFVHQPQVCG